MNDALLNLEETSAPLAEPVSLPQGRKQCRVIDGMTDDDDYIAALIVAARQVCETMTGRAFVRRTFQLRLDRFPYAFPQASWPYYSIEVLPGLHSGRIYLPKPPLASVDAVHYLDTNGVLQLLDPSKYRVETGGELRGRIAPAYGISFPQTQRQMGAVSIDFTAGYSADASKVPIGIQQAILLLVGHWYRNHEAVTEGAFAELPVGVAALLSPFQYGGYG